jgi:hypothetical protein
MRKRFVTKDVLIQFRASAKLRDRMRGASDATQLPVSELWRLAAEAYLSQVESTDIAGNQQGK